MTSSPASATASSANDIASLPPVVTRMSWARTFIPRARARSAYGTSRRIGEAGISVARLESLTLLNATPITFALRIQLLVRHRHAPTPASGGHQINTEQPESEYCLAKLPTEYTRASHSRK